MGLETVNFISDLTPTWPAASESKSQGDDHIRAIKTGVKNTFPNASRAFYFPVTEAISGTLSLDATDWNNIVEVDTSGGNVTVNLPSTLGASDKGWSCEVIKVTSDANAAIVTPAAGTILTKVGTVATVRVGILCEAARFIWNGTGWRCHKPGSMIGSTEEFDGSTLPPGYLLPDGGSFSATLFAELYKALGSSTTVVLDKRGRVTAALGNGSRLTATYFGASSGQNDATVGNVGGLESNALVAANNGTHAHTGTAASHTHQTNATGGVFFATGTGAVRNDLAQATVAVGNSDSASYNTGASGAINLTIDNQGSGTPHANVQPTIIANKIVRAC